LLLSIDNQATPDSTAVSGTPAWNPNDTAASLILGNSANYAAGNNVGLVGDLSNVRLYGAVLSSSQIGSLQAKQEPAGAPLPIGEWQLNEGGGTTVSGSGGNNMVEISANVYDNGEVGDGNVTETVDFPSGSSSPADTLRVTQMFYDWQDRLVATKSGELVTEESTLGPDQSAFQVDGVADWLVFDPGSEGSGGDTTQRSITTTWATRRPSRSLTARSPAAPRPTPMGPRTWSTPPRRN
jgi:hypothetical protein